MKHLFHHREYLFRHFSLNNIRNFITAMACDLIILINIQNISSNLVYVTLCTIARNSLNSILHIFGANMRSLECFNFLLVLHGGEGKNLWSVPCISRSLYLLVVDQFIFRSCPNHFIYCFWEALCYSFHIAYVIL